MVHNNRMIFVSVRAQAHPSGGSTVYTWGLRTLASGNRMGERGSIVVAVFFFCCCFKEKKDFVIISTKLPKFLPSVLHTYIHRSVKVA